MRIQFSVAAFAACLSASASPIPWSEFAAGHTPGADLEIPAGVTVLLDVPEAVVGALTIRGVLDVEDARDAELTAARVRVMGPGAALLAGRPDDPFEHRLTITLTEPIGPADAEPAMGYRVLGVMSGGSLRLHAADAARTSWTQIDGDLAPGATTLRTIAPTGWRPGDRLALAPSGEDAREAERLTVVDVSPDGRTITFEPPLAHARLGRIFTYAGKPIDMRAEVALLSRNIVVRNDPSETDANGAASGKLGFHTMIMPDSGRVELVGVELRGGGQIARRGRYPLHWHRDPALETSVGGRGWQIEAVDRSGDVARACSIHAAGQRGIVLHGVNGVLLEQNVVFDVWDTAFIFSEDGLERDNRLIRNLAMLVKRKSRFDPVEFAFPRTDHTESDQAEHRPAGFWGRNPFNPMIGNVAAGTVEGIGFFIDSQVMNFDMRRLVERVHGLERTVEFRDNRSHSNWREGVAGGGIPTYGPKTRGHGLMIGDYNGAFGAVFEGFQTYRNSVLGVWIEDEAHVLRDAILADSSGGLIAFRSTIEDVVYIQRSDNTLGREPQPLGNRRHPGGGLHLQSTGYGNFPRLDGVTFINVEPAAVYVWQDPLSDDGGTTLRGITLINTPAILHGDDPAGFDGVYEDLDGTLTGLGAGARIGGGRLLDQGGVFIPEFNAVVVPGRPEPCSAADLDEPFGELTIADILAYFARFADADPRADLDGDGTLDLFDVLGFFDAFTAGCTPA